MTNYYYKVVKNESGKLYSANKYSKLTIFSYAKGVETRAPVEYLEQGYGICIFDTFENAECFSIFLDCRGSKAFEIWKVAAKGVWTPKVSRISHQLTNTKSISEVVKRFKVYNAGYYHYDWPNGTLMAESIILIAKRDSLWI